MAQPLPYDLGPPGLASLERFMEDRRRRDEEDPSTGRPPGPQPQPGVALRLPGSGQSSEEEDHDDDEVEDEDEVEDGGVEGEVEAECALVRRPPQPCRGGPWGRCKRTSIYRTYSLTRRGRRGCGGSIHRVPGLAPAYAQRVLRQHDGLRSAMHQSNVTI
ncbi:hypothetical protein TCAL_17205 [Tigriopus californicus]|uniref:Uncharacterized protein n=1 Tax=Tigriopus californicus TaxID=6832 RepID=A0A553N8S8_TIGCA|nr:hypothetical protein TCAL_17205 [Tigriopus californicus]